MFRKKIGGAYKYFKTQIEYLRFLMSNKCAGGKCCDLYMYETNVIYIADGASYASKNTDAADLLAYNAAGRSGNTAVHYINWFEVDGFNVFGNVDLHTDTFRKNFTHGSIGNFGELDISGPTYASAKSWAKNFTKFVNDKFAANNINAKQYTKYEVTVDTSVAFETRYDFKFYVVVPKGVVVGNIQQARYDSAEFGVATGWSFAPIDANHEYPTTLIKQVNCN